MQIRVDKSDAFQAASLLSQISASNKSNSPSSMSTKLVAFDDRITLSAFNDIADCMMEIDVDGKVDQSGQAVVITNKLKEVTGLAPADQLTFNAKAASLMYTSDTYRGKLALVNNGHFPEWRTPDQEIVVPDAGVLRALIARAERVLSIEQNESKLVASVIQLKITKDRIEVYATNESRFVIAGADIKCKVKEPAVFYLQKGYLAVIKRILAEDDGEVRLARSGNRFSMQFGNIRYATKDIAVELPDFAGFSVMPAEAYKAELCGKDLAAALTRVSVALEANKGGAVECKFSGNTLKLRIKGVNEAVEQVPINYSGPEITIGFAVKYLLESVSGSESTTVEFIDGVNRVVWTHNDDKYQARYVVMPYRLV